MKIYNTEEKEEEVEQEVEEKKMLKKRSSLRSCGRMNTLTLKLFGTVGVSVLFSMGSWIFVLILLDKHIFHLDLYVCVWHNDIK